MIRDYDKSFELDGMSGPVEDSLKLEEGMRVDYGGMTGTVEYVNEDCWHQFPVSVLFDEGYKMDFTLDGRQYARQKHTLLKVIGRTENKIKKWVWAVKDRYGTWISTAHMTENEVNALYPEKYTKVKVVESEIEVLR